MYLFFDTETNGMPNNWDAPVTDLSNWPRLVQIAWILCDKSGNNIAQNEHIIKPDGFTISAETSSVHGITTDRALAEGIELIEVLREFKEELEKVDTLVAHNISFDEKIAGAEFLRNNMANSIEGIKKICTMKSTTDYVAIDGNYGYKWPQLGELHQKLFGTDFKDAHNAMADVKATTKCFWEAKERDVL